MLVPEGLESSRALGEPWAAWLDALPRLVPELLAEWELTGTGPAGHRERTLVLPVRTPTDERALLHVSLPDPESEHEALALQHWGGRGAARLLRADPHRRAVLVEHLSDRTLEDLWDVEACEVVASLYATLHVTAPPRLRRLSSLVAERTEALAGLPRSSPLPRRMVEQATALGRSLAADDDGTSAALIHTDVHYASVVAAEREPWLAVGPRPVAGDPHFEVAPLLWHRWPELAGDVRAGVRRRMHAVVDAAGLDEERVRDWVVWRCLVAARGCLAGLRAPERGGAADDLTRYVTVAKAVQD